MTALKTKQFTKSNTLSVTKGNTQLWLMTLVVYVACLALPARYGQKSRWDIFSHSIKLVLRFPQTVSLLWQQEEGFLLTFTHKVQQLVFFKKSHH